ncbi:MAG TPA: DUF6526 family protein [Candidatus Binatia bacterium]|nr:DUF6526 family protein [Candidatus Binatia bacterium]
MPENPQQNFANHTRLDPWFHFFVLPVFAIALLMTLVHFVAHFSEGDGRDRFHSFLLVLLAAALLAAVFKIRLYSLKVQDRVIRLEERQRLALLLPESQRARIPELTVGQLVALRFASDAELPALAQRALDEKLAPKDIKKAIQNWRADYWRV